MHAPNPSTEWYERHAVEYAARTQDSDLSHLYDRFLPRLPAGGHICDAGCGSGRDTLAFRARGFAVTPFDGAAAMAALAAERTGAPVAHLRFADVAFEAEFDGVWACASLLHVTPVNRPDAVARLARALRPGGVLFMSFKHDAAGPRDLQEGDRLFGFLDVDALRALVATTEALDLIDCWTSADTRPGRDHETWISALARRL